MDCFNNVEICSVFAQWSYQRVKECYPDTVVAARQLIIEYLHRYDRHRLEVFRGSIVDSHNDGHDLHEAFFLISDILHEEQNGNKSVTPLTKEVFCRAYLKLPYAAVQGGSG